VEHAYVAPEFRFPVTYVVAMTVVLPVEVFATSVASIHEFSVLTDTIRKSIVMTLRTIMRVNDEGFPWGGDEEYCWVAPPIIF
jgi:hypothetical protein